MEQDHDGEQGGHVAGLDDEDRGCGGGEPGRGQNRNRKADGERPTPRIRQEADQGGIEARS